MGLPHLRHPGYTLEDWKTWPGRWELIDGVAFDMAPTLSLAHQEISMSLAVSFHQAITEAMTKHDGGSCKVFAAPTDVFLFPTTVVQPDLLVVCDPAKLSERGIEGAPDLVVEILSPATANKDWTTKRWQYEAAGVPEYLIVDPIEKVGVLLKLEGQHYQEAARLDWGELGLGNRVKLLNDRIQITVGR